MERVVVQSRTGPDGVLHLDVPLGPSAANREVSITVETTKRDSPPMSPQEWAAFVERIAGSIPDASFYRHDVGSLEERDFL